MEKKEERDEIEEYVLGLYAIAYAFVAIAAASKVFKDVLNALRREHNTGDGDA